MIRKLFYPIRWAYAAVFGYFWLPCPVCKEMFGGHEIPDGLTIPLISEDNHAYCVCSYKCSKRAQQLNKQNGKFWPTFIQYGEDV